MRRYRAETRTARANERARASEREKSRGDYATGVKLDEDRTGRGSESAEPGGTTEREKQPERRVGSAEEKRKA